MADKKHSDSCWAGFDLGGTKMMAVLFDDRFEEIGRERKKTKPTEGRSAGLARMIRTLQDALTASDIKPNRLRGIGIGCPGPVDMKTGIVLEAPNLGWHHVHVRAALEKAFGCPIEVANDVDAGLLGEYMFGAARGARCSVGIFPGTGIGGACIYEGRILSGSGLSCMEIGHIPLQPDGPLCGCGKRGCLEALAGRLAVASAVALEAHRGHAPFLLSRAGTNPIDMRSGAIADAIRAGERSVEAVVRQSAKWLGIGIAVTVNLLAPDVVVLGGGLVEAMPDFYVKEAEKSAREFCMSTYRNRFKVRKASLGDDAVALGAAALARQADAS